MNKICQKDKHLPHDNSEVSSILKPAQFRLVFQTVSWSETLHFLCSISFSQQKDEYDQQMLSEIAGLFKARLTWEIFQFL